MYICYTFSVKFCSRFHNHLKAISKAFVEYFKALSQIALFASLYQSFTSCDSVSDKHVTVLSSAKLCSSESLVLIVRLFIKILKRMGPSIDA